MHDCNEVGGLKLVEKKIEELISKSLSYRDQEEYQIAIKYAEESIKIDPDYLQPYFEIALNLKGLGKNDSALKRINQYIELDPDYFDAYLIKSRLLFELKRFDETLDLLDSIHSKVGTANEWAMIGIIYTHLSEYDKALFSFNQSLSIESENSYALCFKGFTLKRLGRKEEVMNITKKMSQNNDNTVCYEENLRDKLAKDLSLLDKFGYNLKLIKKEFKCLDRPGFIDLLCENPMKNKITVIELKIERATSATYKQISDYLDSVSKTIGIGKNLNGIVISGLADEDFIKLIKNSKYPIEHIEIEQLGFHSIWFNFLMNWRHPEWYYQ